MGRIITADMNTARQEEWPHLDGVEVLEGEPASRGFVVPVADDSGNAPLVGSFTADSPRTLATFHNEYETIHVLEGEVEIALDDGQTVQLAAGHIATLPKGHRTVWKITQTPFRELFVIHG